MPEKLPAPLDKCPLCGEDWWNLNEHNNAYCGHCEMNWSEMEDFHHTGFYTQVDGVPVHVRGDPNMSDDTLKAIQEMARAAMKAIEDGTLPRKKKGEAVSEKPTLDLIIGERLAGMYREKYPVTDKTEIVQLVAESPGSHYQDHFDVPWRYLRDGGYVHRIPRSFSILDAGKSPVVSPYDKVEVGKFEQWADSAKDRRWWLAYVPRRDMLFIC